MSGHGSWGLECLASLPEGLWRRFWKAIDTGAGNQDHHKDANQKRTQACSKYLLLVRGTQACIPGEPEQGLNLSGLSFLICKTRIKNNNNT